MAVYPADFIAASLQRYSHTNGSVTAHCISASCPFSATQNICCCYFSLFIKWFQSVKERCTPRQTEVCLQAAERAWQVPQRGNFSCCTGRNRLYSGTFLQTLQSAGHHSATFLIVASKCSLDTLFKRIAGRTCATRHAGTWWMISNVSTNLI